MKHTSPSINLSGDFDKCLIGNYISKIFPASVKSGKGDFLKVYKSVEEVQSVLHTLNADGKLELSLPYLTAMQRPVPGMEFRYAVLYHKHKPVLFGYFQLFTITSANFGLDEKGGMMRRIIRFLMDIKKVRVLILGNAMRNETCCFCYDRGMLDEIQAVSLLGSIAEEIASDECALAVVLKDIPDSDGARQWLAAQKYQTPWPDQLMILDVRPGWTSLDLYLEDLSRKYRARANKILASLGSVRVEKLEMDRVAQLETKIDGLFGNVLDSQRFLLTRPGTGHFTDLMKNYGDQFEVYGYFDGEELIAFFTAFITPDAYEMYYVGFDYSLNPERQLYFNILFAGLERAILNKKKHLNFGRTSFDAKASMGAQAVERKYYFKAPGIPDAVTGWFVNFFSALEDGKWRLRNPLKQPA